MDFRASGALGLALVTGQGPHGVVAAGGDDVGTAVKKPVLISLSQPSFDLTVSKEDLDLEYDLEYDAAADSDCEIIEPEARFARLLKRAGRTNAK